MSAIVKEKSLAFFLTAFILWYFSPRTVLLFVIVLGHGHFLSAYFYQYKAGKFTKKSLLGYLAWAVLITVWYRSTQAGAALLTITTVYFLIHMLWDELYLLRTPMRLWQPDMHLGRTLEMLPLVLVYSGRIIDSSFLEASSSSLYLHRALWATLPVFFCYLLLVVRGYRPDYKSYYFMAANLIVCFAGLQSWLSQFDSAQLMGTVILYHYFVWYLHYFNSLSPGASRRLYAQRIFVINALVLGAFFYWGQGGLGVWFFHEASFYIWTLLHLISSTRKGDLTCLLKMPKLSRA